MRARCSLLNSKPWAWCQACSGCAHKRFGEGVNDNTYQVHPNQLVAELVPAPRSHLSSFFHLFFPLPLPSVNTDCARVSIGDETIRINGPVLAHNVVDSQTQRIPCSQTRLRERDTRGAASAERECSQLSIFPGRKASSHYQNKIKKGLLWLVELVQYLV